VVNRGVARFSNPVLVRRTDEFFEGTIESLDHRDTAMLANGTETWFDAVSFTN